MNGIGVQQTHIEGHKVRKTVRKLHTPKQLTTMPSGEATSNMSTKEMKAKKGQE